MTDTQYMHLSPAARAWRKAWQYLIPTLNFRDWTIVLLMALWLYLNIFDLLITYQGLTAGTAYEANRFFAGIMHLPVLAVAIKMILSYCVLKLVQRVETRTPYSGLVPLMLANIYLCWVCLHNLNILNGVTEGSHLLRFFPLAGPLQ